MKTYAILVSFIVVGLILSLLCQVLPEGHWLSTWLMQLAGILVIGGGLGIIDKTLLIRGHIGQIRDMFRIHESTTEFGLMEVVIDANHYDYGNMICESPLLTMVFNDGRTWTSARISDFKARFAKDGFSTEVFVPEPQSKTSDLIGEKTGYTAIEQADKINQSTKRLIEEFEIAGKTGHLKIYHIPFFPTHSIFLGAETGTISLYGVASKRQIVPLFAFQKTASKISLYANIAHDIELLKNESRCFYDSTAKQDQDTAVALSNVKENKASEVA